MQKETEYNYSSYFEQRGVTPEYYEKYEIPKYLSNELPINKEARILDIGCRLGQFLNRLKINGYSNTKLVWEDKWIGKLKKLSKIRENYIVRESRKRKKWKIKDLSRIRIRKKG